MKSLYSMYSKLAQALILVVLSLNTACNSKRNEKPVMTQPAPTSPNSRSKTERNCCTPNVNPDADVKFQPEVSSAPISEPDKKADTTEVSTHASDLGLVSAPGSQASRQQVSLPAVTPAEPPQQPKVSEPADQKAPPNLERVSSLKELNEKVAKSEEQSSGLDVEETQKWHALLEWVSEIAKTDTSPQSRETFLFIEEATPENREKNHVNRGISLVGGFSESGQFGFSRVQMLIEDWSFHGEGEMQGVLHHFVLDRNGQLVFMMNKELIKTKAGRVLKDQELEISKEKASIMLTELKKYWFARMENSKIQKK